MGNLSTVLVIIFLPVVMSAVVSSSRKAEESMIDDVFTVRRPKPFLWVGIVWFLACCAIIILVRAFGNDTVDTWFYAIFILLALLGAFIVFYCVLWKINVSDGKLMFSSVFVRNREIDLNSVIRVVETGQKIIVYADSKKCFTVENSAVGYEKLKEFFHMEGVSFE